MSKMAQTQYFADKNYNFTQNYKLFIFSKLCLSIKQSMNDYSWEQENDKQNILKSKAINKQPNNYDDDFQDEYNKKQNKNIQLPKITQKTASKPTQKQTKPKPLKSDEQNYEEDFDQPSTKKMEQKSRQKNSNTLQKNKRAKSPLPQKVQKVSTLDRAVERKSVQDTQNANTSVVQSKYLYYIKTQFPHSRQQIAEFAPQKINRLNQKLKGYIRKVNDELTDLINDNMRKLKAKSLQKNVETKTVEDQIRILTEQTKNREVYIETIEKENKKLVDRCGKIKQEELEINMDYETIEIKQKIKECFKQINAIKLNMHYQGNKLAEQNNFTERTNDVKSKIISLRKQEDRNMERIDKCDKQFQQLNKKLPQIERQFEKLLQQAKGENVVVNLNSFDKKKHEKIQEFKKKQQNLKLHKDKTVGLNQTKIGILKRQIQILNGQIAEGTKRSSHLDTQINSALEMSKVLIQESKNKELQPYVHTHLDFIYKNIQQSGNLIHNRSTFKPSKTSKQKAIPQQHSKHGLKKYSSVTNAHLYNRSQSQAQLKPSFHITKKSPLILKNKEKNALKLSQKPAEQRVWKQVQGTVETKKPNNDLSLKPFAIKKSQNTVQQKPKIEQKQKTVVNKSHEKQNQKSNLLGPKMKFKKQQSSEKNLEVEKDKATISQTNTNQLKKSQIQNSNTESKPHFKIKKAVKQRIQIPEQDLYLFPTSSKDNLVKNQPLKEKPSNGSPNKDNQPNSSSKKLNLSSKGPDLKLKNNSNSSKQVNQTGKLNLDEYKVNQPGAQIKPVLDVQREKQMKKQSTISKQKLRLEKVSEPKITNLKQQPKQSNSQTAPSDQVNFGGRRQVQRKIQRKNQDAYGV